MKRDKKTPQPQLAEPSKRNAQELFDAMMNRFGANQYTDKSSTVPENQRFVMHQSVAASSLSVLLGIKKRWKFAYALGIEFENGRQDFIEVGKRDLTSINTWAKFEKYVQSKAVANDWRKLVDALELASILSPEGEMRWRSIAVVYAGRFDGRILTIKTPLIGRGTRHSFPAEIKVAREIAESQKASQS